jgi:hypothetical protein
MVEKCCWSWTIKSNLIIILALVSISASHRSSVVGSSCYLYVSIEWSDILSVITILLILSFYLYVFWNGLIYYHVFFMFKTSGDQWWYTYAFWVQIKCTLYAEVLHRSPLWRWLYYYSILLKQIGSEVNLGCCDTLNTPSIRVYKTSLATWTLIPDRALFSFLRKPKLEMAL